MPAPRIRSHDFWRYINLYVCMCVSPVVGSCGRAVTAKTRPEDIETLVYVTLLTERTGVKVTRTSDGWDVTTSSDVYASMQCMRSVASLPALGPWAPPPAERGPSLESIYRVSLTVDLYEGNKIISFKKLISPQPVGAPQKEKKSGDPGHVPSVPIG